MTVTEKISSKLAVALLLTAHALAAQAADVSMPFDVWVKTRPALVDSGEVIGLQLCSLLDPDLEEMHVAHIENYLPRAMKKNLPHGDLATALATPACYWLHKPVGSRFPFLHMVVERPETRMPVLSRLEAYYQDKLGRPDVFSALLSVTDSRGYTMLDNVEEELRSRDQSDWYKQTAAPLPAYLCQRGVTYAHYANRCSAQAYATEVAELEAKVRHGDTKAMLQLADMHGRGLGMPKNAAQAIAYYRKAATAGDAEGLELIASAYFNGVGLDRDGRDWVAYAEVAKRTRDFMQLGRIYMWGGHGLNKDARVAMGYFSQAIDAGNKDGYVMAARMADELGDWPALKHYAETGARDLGPGGEDYAELMMLHARMYKLGTGVPRDESRYIALRYEFSACECGRKGAVENRFTDRSDLDVISRFAERGDERALYLMGEQYLWGRLGLKDYAGASPWYHKAARAGEPYSQEKLGLMYDNGLGVKEDRDIAKEWYAKAAKQGNHSAQYAIEHWND